jgi:hypothetical protein
MALREGILGALALAVALLGCGGDGGEPAEEPVFGGDPRGERAFVGALRLGPYSGTCTLLVPAIGSAETVRARCSTGAGEVVELTGLLTAATAKGHGAIEVSGTDAAGARWTTISGFIANAFPTDLGPRLFGSGLTIQPQAPGTPALSGRVSAQDATLEPVTAWCGTFSHPSTAGAGAWAMQGSATLVTGVFVAPAPADGGMPHGAWRLFSANAGPSPLALTTYEAGAATGSASCTFSAGSASGTFVEPGLGPGAGSFAAGPCAPPPAHVCCGTGPATRCCFATACPCG